MNAETQRNRSPFITFCHFMIGMTISTDNLDAHSDDVVWEFTKALVYGLGRGTGIRIRPCRYIGRLTDRMRALYSDLENAERQPSDDALGTPSLTSAHASSLSARDLVVNIAQYIGARLSAQNQRPDVEDADPDGPYLLQRAMLAQAQARFGCMPGKLPDR